MIEAQIGQLYLGGESYSPLLCLWTSFYWKVYLFQDDISFAIVIELKDDAPPSHSDTAVCINALEKSNSDVDLCILIGSSPMDSCCNAAYDVRHFR